MRNAYSFNSRKSTQFLTDTYPPFQLDNFVVIVLHVLIFPAHEKAFDQMLKALWSECSDTERRKYALKLTKRRKKIEIRNVTNETAIRVLCYPQITWPSIKFPLRIYAAQITHK